MKTYDQNHFIITFSPKVQVAIFLVGFSISLQCTEWAIVLVEKLQKRHSWFFAVAIIIFHFSLLFSSKVLSWFFRFRSRSGQNRPSKTADTRLAVDIWKRLNLKKLAQYFWRQLGKLTNEWSTTSIIFFSGISKLVRRRGIMTHSIKKCDKNCFFGFHSVTKASFYFPKCLFLARDKVSSRESMKTRNPSSWKQAIWPTMKVRPRKVPFLYVFWF